MRDFFKKTPLRILILLASILGSLIACLLLYFFAQEVDLAYSNLITRDVKARQIIQSINDKRIKNVENILKIEAATNTDTIDVYLNKWYKKAVEIGDTFDSLKLLISSDSSHLTQELDDVIAKRKVAIAHTKNVLSLERNNPDISIVDSIKEDTRIYQKSMNDFLENYNKTLLETSIKISKQTIKKSNLYLSILPIPLVVLFIIFIYTFVVVLRDFSKDEE